MQRYLTSEEAAERLGVSRQTLYAYVSRGLLKADQVGEDPRRSLYLADVVEAFASQRRVGRRPKEVARSTLDWGVPALESAITAIEDGRLYYRGVDAEELAEKASLEQVAALLWQCGEEPAFGPQQPAMAPAYEALLPMIGGRESAEALQALLAVAARDEDTAAWRRSRPDFFKDCGDLVRQCFAIAAGSKAGAAPLHAQLAACWNVNAEGADLLRAALVLCADHELNASSFTARCIASTGASLKAAVLGGLGALSGGQHGGVTTRVESFWSGLAGRDPVPAIRRRLSSGEDVPGLGHPLYPHGDIRALLLFQRILPRFAEAETIVATVEELTGRKASIDMALVVLRRYLDLPPGAAFSIFALGRTVGWIAQALEQWEAKQLIRPRAIYTGPSPQRKG